MKIGIVAGHIFMQQAILPDVIFSPGRLAIQLAEDLQDLDNEVSLYTPGAVKTKVTNITANLSGFQAELKVRDDSYLDLLQKHPLTFVSLARQVQAELIAQAIADANNGKLDILHVYMNEEELALPFSQFCNKPVVFTHHDPFNFLTRYRAMYPRYAQLSWISMSLAQRQSMPADTNWTANIYHGLPLNEYKIQTPNNERYLAFIGRIVEPKGVHLAIQAVQAHNVKYPQNAYKLKIAGKHYNDHNDGYWKKIEKLIDGHDIQYVGFFKSTIQKQAFLGGASGLLMPSTFDEPFGMVMIEALACGTPIIGLNSGAIPEIIEEGKTGFVVKTPTQMTKAIEKLSSLQVSDCRQSFERRFTSTRMAQEHLAAYQKLQDN